MFQRSSPDTRGPFACVLGAALSLSLFCACHTSADGGSGSAPPAAPASTARPAAPTEATKPVAAAALPAAHNGLPPPSALLKVERTTEMMGTIIKILVVGETEEKAAPAIEAALAEMRRLADVLSEWRDDSEVSKINHAAGLHPVKVGPDTLINIKVGNDTARWSDGAFDLSWAALHDLYTFQPGHERVPTPAELKQRLPLIRYQDIVVNDKAQTVFLKRKGMRLGLGGIAKGYALDRAAEILQKAGLPNYMIFGGGQVMVHGKKGDRAWRVGIQHPRMDDYFAFLELSDASISTSGDYEHAFFKDKERWHHIIDLHTGLPVRHTTSVTVVCSSGFYGDAVDTAMFIMGAEKTLQKLKDAPGPPMEVVIVDKDLRVHTSPGIADKLIWRMKLQDGKLPSPDAAGP
jgi:thiamine biosynthesis lipoprotein